MAKWPTNWQEISRKTVGLIRSGGGHKIATIAYNNNCLQQQQSNNHNNNNNNNDNNKMAGNSQRLSQSAARFRLASGAQKLRMAADKLCQREWVRASSDPD